MLDENSIDIFSICSCRPPSTFSTLTLTYRVRHDPDILPRRPQTRRLCGRAFHLDSRTTYLPPRRSSGHHCPRTRRQLALCSHPPQAVPSMEHCSWSQPRRRGNLGCAIYDAPETACLQDLYRELLLFAHHKRRQGALAMRR